MRTDEALSVERTAELFAPGADFGLKDAIALKHAYVDQSHKFWTYFQIASATVSGFAWQSTPPTNAVLIGLGTAFFFFAVANRRLVVDAQRAACDVSVAIDTFLRDTKAAQENALISVANTRKLDEPKRVRQLHWLLTVVVLGLLTARFVTT